MKLFLIAVQKCHDDAVAPPTGPMRSEITQECCDEMRGKFIDLAGEYKLEWPIGVLKEKEDRND